jgi:acyl-CoA:acyl-CoA alkyltransferase
MYTQGHSRILGVGSFVPEKCITSKEVLETLDSENRFGIKTDWLERVMGVRERRVSPDDWFPSDLAVASAKRALDDAKLLPKDIDAIIYAGVIRDYLEPATAHVVQQKLGATNALAFDVTNACLGFMNAIHVMDSLIASGQARRGLVITGEQGFRFTLKASKVLLQSSDKALFAKLAAGLTLGDAGAALIMGPKTDPDTGIKGIMVRSEGEHYRLCVCPDGGDETALETDMPAIVAQTARLVKATYADLTTKLGWSSDEIALYLPHQVGIKGLKIHMAITGIKESKVPNSVETMGNIISATIPFTLDMARERGMLHAGDKVFLSGTGSGICAGQAGLMWDAA